MKFKNAEAFRRLIALCLCASFACSIPCAVSAQQTDRVEYGVADVQLPDSDDLYAGYVDNLFGVETESGKLPKASGIRTLDAATQVFYGELSEKIRLVADGTITDTEFVFQWSDLTEKYGMTAKQLKKFDIQRLLVALLSDYPYELYWFDKTTSISSTTSDSRCKFKFYVSADYSESGEAKTKKTDVNKTSAAAKAKENALAVLKNVDPNWSDYRVMQYFKDTICSLVDYDYNSALNYSTVKYGDPWQMIHVFDGDKNTNVVCEGYSKAFKFLCDNYNFNSDVKCELITGQMTSTSASGSHMWNNVTIGDRVYIADVTNSDTKSIGADEQLFIKGVPESGRLYTTDKKLNGVQLKVKNSNVTYVYDEYTLMVFDESELDISTRSPKLHTVEWRDRRDNVIETDELVADGERPVYNGERTVSIWQPEIDETTVISGGDDTIVYTEFNDKKAYTVTYVVPTEGETRSELLYEDESVGQPKAPEIDGMEFAGWFSDENYNEPYVFGSTLTDDTAIYACYTAKVEWRDDEGEVLYIGDYPVGTVPVYVGETPVKESTQAYTYTFAGWSPEVTEVTGATAYEAVFDSFVRSYTVTWKNYDGEILETRDVPYGATPSYSGSVPVKNSDGDTVYTFSEWDKEPTAVTGDCTYTAVYESKMIEQPTTDEPTPDEPTPDEPTPDEPTPDEPTPDEPTPDEPTPDEPTPDEPTPDEPTPDEPTPDEPTPDEPTPYEPTPDEPTPDEPTPVDPTPVDPTPIDPTPVDPTPVDPTPIDPTPVDSTPDEPTETDDNGRKCGDVNNDGSVDSTDALAILRISVGLSKLTEEDRLYGDVNGDNDIDSTDALSVLRFSVGIKDNDRIGSIIR